MKGDFTRDTFDPAKHFRGVLMQQGRVQLDADWNEQAAILLHYLQTLAVDLIGLHGGPGDGFKIIELPPTPSEVKNDFAIENGHYYVDGILCELGGMAVPISVQPPSSGQVQVPTWVVDNLEFQERQYVEVFDAAQQPPVPTPFQITKVDQAKMLLTLDTPLPGSISTARALRLRRITTYLTQPDYPVPEGMKLHASTHYLVYLDVWERHISYLEDEGSINIREVALGGPDTATRAKVVWQVKVMTAKTEVPLTCAAVNTLPALSAALLSARARQDQQQTDPCLIQPDARYRGAENQLYRVEIHTGNIDQEGNREPETTPTFKWSRENGAVVLPIIAPVATAGNATTVTLAHCGYDDKLGLYEGAWVEIVDDDYVLHNRAEPLLQVQVIDRDQMTVTLNGTLPPTVGTDLSKHPLLRRWDQAVGVTLKGVLPIVEKIGADATAWLPLEDGVQIQFQPGGSYRTGDYWLIPARTATGDVEWPKLPADPKVSQPVRPHGVAHYYAPLAIISVDASGNVKVDTSQHCRHIINKLGTPEP